MEYGKIQNYIERDAYGKFTRRATLENLTAKYAERYAVMVRMYEEKKKKTVIVKTFGEADYSVNKLINSLDIKKPKTHISEIPQKKRQLIRDEFAKGLSLTELKTKYKVRDYGSLYKILGNAAVGSNYKIPDEYQKYKKEKEEGIEALPLFLSLKSTFRMLIHKAGLSSGPVVIILLPAPAGLLATTATCAAGRYTA